MWLNGSDVLSCLTAMDTLITMSTNALLDTIERRIAELVRPFVMPPSDERSDDPCAVILHTTANQAVTSSEGGKRLRAMLTMDTFNAVTAEPQQHAPILDIACAIEVFQTAALVHDDIIDDADLRRGKPAAHKALAASVHDAPLGMGLGIMLGDLLATASVDIANNAARQLPNADAIVSAFLTMHREVEIGQVLDLAAARYPMSDPERLAETSLNVFRWKTASYTTIAPLKLGLLAAGMSVNDACHHALSIGTPLGLAFQLADDLIDVIGSSSATGKPVGGDIREGKRTVLLADALHGATLEQRHELITMFEAPSRTDEQIHRTIELFHATGAINRSRLRIADLWKNTLAAIRCMPLSDDAMQKIADSCARFVPSVHYTHQQPLGM